jgi:hypothetical protein
MNLILLSGMDGGKIYQGFPQDCVRENPDVPNLLFSACSVVWKIDLHSFCRSTFSTPRENIDQRHTVNKDGDGLYVLSAYG